MQRKGGRGGQNGKWERRVNANELSQRVQEGKTLDNE